MAKYTDLSRLDAIATCQLGGSTLIRSSQKLFFVATLLAFISTAFAQTPAVSTTTDPTNGYPLWYQDASIPGIRVEGCLDAKDPFCVLLADPGFIPANPLVFPTNFPVEFFYVVADANPLTTPGCPAAGIAAGKAKYRAAVEGSFLTGVQQPGQQSTFARTKIVASGLCPNTTYTFTTPYGADLVTTDAAGAVVANKKGATIDIGCTAAPCNFSAALASRVFGGFLRFDPAFNVPPPGYLGDAGPVAGTLSPVIGSPTGTNLFSITGPAGVIASTNLFTVSGKIAGPLMSAPNAIDFGGQTTLTTSTPRTVTITNVYPASITVTSLSFTGANLADFRIFSDTCTGIALAEDQSCVIGMTFTPSTTLAESAQLNVFHNGPFRSPRVVNLAGTGTVAGSLPVVSLSAPSLAFGSQRVLTTSAAQTVTVSNTGTAPLGATVALANADPTLFAPAANQFAIVTDTCSGSFVAAGATCSVSLSFAPTVAAAATALLTFTDTALGSPQSVTLTGTGTGGIAAVSTTLDIYAYPNWYQDENGLQVQPCLNPADPLCVLLADPNFNPALPLSFSPTATSINFPVEFFYAVADSDKIATPGCPSFGIAPGTAKYRAALEGSFVTGTATWGQQSTFARTKIVVSGLCPNTTYAMTHPYGTDLVTANAAGQVVANKKGATIDTGCLGAPCDFTIALSSRLFGGFIKWDPAVPPAAPIGRLGDAGAAVGTLHPIVGSPFKDPVSGAPANFFRIADPVTGAVIGKTNLFTVSGKLATPLAFGPGPLTFGPQIVATASVAQTVTVSNIDPVSSATISTVTILVTPGGLASLDFLKGTDTCSGATLAPTGTCTIAVSFTPTAAGALAGVLVINHSGLNTPVEVPLFGTGLATLPAVSLSAASVPFGNELVGVASLPQTVTVTNTGGANLLVSTVTLGGTNPGDFSISSDTCSAATVIPTGTCTVGVTFTPSVAGARSAVLNIADNVVGSPQTVSLSGTGVLPATTTTSLLATAVTFPANGSVTITVSSAAGTPIGSVSLSVDAVALPAQTLVGGSTTFIVTAPTVGSHALVASYAAQGSFGASSASGTLVVNPAASATSVSAPAVTSPSDGSVAVTVSSTAGTPTGSVTLTVDGVALPAQALVGGSTTFTIIAPAVGNHALVASYAAQGNFAASSATGTLVVNPAGASATTTSIVAPAVTFPANGSVTVTVSSAAGTPTGSVSLTVDGVALAAQTLVGGSTTFTVNAPTVGNHALLASYAAQSTFAGSSAAGTLAVNPATTATSISAPAVTSPANGLVSVTVSSAAGIPAGNVSLSVDGGAAIVQALVNGSTTFTLISPAAGTHTLSASYAAQGSFAASSATGTLLVNAGAATDILTVTSATARLKVSGKTATTTASWKITGTTSIPVGNTITVTLTRTGQVIGTAKPNGNGSWTVNQNGSTIVPIAGDTITATSTFGTQSLRFVTIQ